MVKKLFRCSQKDDLLFIKCSPIVHEIHTYSSQKKFMLKLMLEGVIFFAKN